MSGNQSPTCTAALGGATSLPLTALRQQTHLWKVKTARWCKGQISLAICFNPSHSRIVTVSQPINTQWPPYPFCFPHCSFLARQNKSLSLLCCIYKTELWWGEKRQEEQSEAIQSADWALGWPVANKPRCRHNRRVSSLNTGCKKRHKKGQKRTDGVWCLQWLTQQRQYIDKEL